MGRRLASLLCAVLAVGCLGAPRVSPPDRSGAWGYVRLVPREGVTISAGPGAAYGDRRLRDALLVDYSKPGFGVVYGPGPAPGGRATIVIRGAREARLDPPHAAVGVGGSIRAENASTDPHVLSAPGVGLVRRLGPGEAIEIPVAQAGEQPLFLLDAPRAAASVFVAPGPFAVVAASGRFELVGLDPGQGALRVWHPRLPPGESVVELPPGRAVRVDFELGVDHMESAGGADGAF